MSLKTDKIQLEILLKGDKSRKELTELEVTTKKLARELKKLPQDTEAFKQKFEELKKAEARMEELRKEIGLTGMTMRELRNRAKELSLAMNHIDPRTPQYKAYRAELDQVNARMRELKTGTDKAGFSFSKMADGFNKYMGVFAAVSAGILGVVLSMRKMVDAYDEYEQKVANLSAITGLAGEELDWLSSKAKELSTSTTDSGVRITKSADEIVDAFTKVGSKRPELLANKDAMAQVTEQALILAEAGQTDLETAIDAVTASMNQFNLGADQSERIINTLAAGSLEGSAEIDSLSGSLKNAGTVAAASNMTIEETVAALEVLASKQLLGEEAGTKFRGALLKMKEAGVGYQSGVFNMRDALVETNQILASTGSQMEKDAKLQKIFGTENVTVGTILLGNIDAYDKLTKAVTDTDTAVKQATTNTSTHKAELAQAKNRAHLMAIELGEKLAPIMTFSTNVATMFLKALMKLPDIVRENKVLFIALGTALLAYNAKSIEAAGRRVKEWFQWRKMLIEERIEMAKNSYAKKLAEIQSKNLASKTGVLKGAFQKLFALIKMNPLGAFIVVAGAALAIIAKLATTTEKASASTRMMTEINKRAASSMVEERSKLDAYLAIAKDVNRSYDERAKAIKALNELSPKYLGNLTVENINTAKGTELIDQYIAALGRKARAQASMQMLQEKNQEILDIMSDNNWDNLNKAQKLWYEGEALASRTGMSGQAYYESAALMKIEKIKSEIKAINDAIKLMDAEDVVPETTLQPDPNISSGSTIPDATTAAKELKTAYELLNEEIAKYEKLLQDQVVTGDANASATAVELQNLKDKKATYDELIKNLQDAAFLEAELARMGNTIPMMETGRTTQKESTEEAPAEKIKAVTGAEIFEAWKAQQDAMLQYREYIESQIVSLANNSQDVIEAYATRSINRKYNFELSRLQKRLAQGQMSEDQYNTALEKLNAEKETKLAKIKRRGANFEKGITATQTLVDGYKSVAAIKAKVAEITAAAALNPLLIPSIGIAAAQIPIVIASSALSAGLIAAKPVQEYAMGRYPVLGKSGRKYDAVWNGNPRTGIYNKPTLSVFAENSPELIVDYPTLRTLRMRSPEVLTEIYRAAGKVKEYAEGKYPAGVAPAGGSSELMTVLIQQNGTIIQLLSGINANFANVQTYKDLYERLDEEAKRKSFINEKFRG